MTLGVSKFDFCGLSGCGAVQESSASKGYISVPVSDVSPKAIAGFIPANTHQAKRISLAELGIPGVSSLVSISEICDSVISLILVNVINYFWPISVAKEPRHAVRRVWPAVHSNLRIAFVVVASRFSARKTSVPFFRLVWSVSPIEFPSAGAVLKGGVDFFKRWFFHNSTSLAVVEGVAGPTAAPILFPNNMGRKGIIPSSPYKET